MKTLLLSLSVLFSVSAFADLTYRVDMRPVDGNMTEFKIKNENKRNSASVKLILAGVNRENGKSWSLTVYENTGMDCKVSDSGVVCEKDLRPVDGAKDEVLVMENDFGSYDVIKKSTYVSRMSGKEIFETTILASSLDKVSKK